MKKKQDMMKKLLLELEKDCEKNMKNKVRLSSVHKKNNTY